MTINSDSQSAPSRCVATALMVLVLLVLSGCSSEGDGGVEAAEPTSSSTETTSGEAADDQDRELQAIETWEFRLTYEGGEVVEATLELFDPVRPEALAQEFGNLRTLQANFIGVDGSTSLVVPARLTLTNASDEFAIKGYAGTTALSKRSESVKLFVHPGGETLNDTIGPPPESIAAVGFAPSETKVIRGGILVPRYFGPNAPDGDPSILDAAEFVVSPVTEVVRGPGEFHGDSKKYVLDMDALRGVLDVL